MRVTGLPRRMVLAVVGFLAAMPTGAHLAPAEEESFDYYVLDLTWFPNYCRPDRRHSHSVCQDAANRRFTVHGLWPDYQRGWPENCHADFRAPSRDLLDQYKDIMLSYQQGAHEWKKHGSCTGLTPQAYFDLTRQAYEKINIPSMFSGQGPAREVSASAIKQAFFSDNKGLGPEGMSISCHDGYLAGIEICLDTQLNFVSCPAIASNGCDASEIKVVFPN
ncbi:ribonuclease T [Roseibium sp. RKSG952]|uniref:ribonuclease T2 family protein n=1 Tax=Roseibium sp. RKSG952 TaxID=2529384 RepID=UPI0012BD8158|nr:ribonuclease T [Roseibium sp. RKSG952]MTH96942.1 ribonuclease T [Roseibium sp. RKSG952]